LIYVKDQPALFHTIHLEALLRGELGRCLRGAAEETAQNKPLGLLAANLHAAEWQRLTGPASAGLFLFSSWLRVVQQESPGLPLGKLGGIFGKIGREIAVARSLVLVVTLLLSGMASSAEIYRCKTYQGGTYWSSGPCRDTNGIMVDIVQVPDGMPFKEQARMADQVYNAKEARKGQESQAFAASNECAAIEAELKQIWSRYNNWQFNQADQISRDQIRTRELNNRRAQLGCQSR
jgi:hypothetical protein